MNIIELCGKAPLCWQAFLGEKDLRESKTWVYCPNLKAPNHRDINTLSDLYCKHPNVLTPGYWLVV